MRKSSGELPPRGFRFDVVGTTVATVEVVVEVGEEVTGGRTGTVVSSIVTGGFVFAEDSCI